MDSVKTGKMIKLEMTSSNQLHRQFDGGFDFHKVRPTAGVVKIPIGPSMRELSSSVASRMAWRHAAMGLS